MNPNTLFDYLDGKLNESERAEVERGLTSDPKLQRELAIAREIHKGMRGAREIVPQPEVTPPGSALGRRVAAAFIVLVLVNVFIGIAFIIGKDGGKSKPPATHEAAIRQQLTESLKRTAETAMPPPTIAPDIILTSTAAERESVAQKVIDAATQCGGSAVKALPDERSLAVVVDLPGEREHAFRQMLVPLGASAPADDSSQPPSARTLLQVRIIEPAK